MNFLEYPAYVMGCLGVGDILCSLNALENIGVEQKRRICVYVCHADYFSRVRCIYESLELKLVDLHCIDYDQVVTQWDERHTIFQAFGMEVSWVDGWLYGWGLRSNLGHESMVRFRRQSPMVAGSVGVSFTVKSHPVKNASRNTVLKLISQFLQTDRPVTYFGYREPEDSYLQALTANGLRICPHDLQETIARIGTCESFVGADSGMSWIAAFSRVRTTIVVGLGLQDLPQTFSAIPWVSIEREANKGART